VRGGEVRNNERKKGKGETRVEKMRWRRKMKFGIIIAEWVEELACHQLLLGWLYQLIQSKPNLFNLFSSSKTPCYTQR